MDLTPAENLVEEMDKGNANTISMSSTPTNNINISSPPKIKTSITKVVLVRRSAISQSDDKKNLLNFFYFGLKEGTEQGRKLSEERRARLTAR